MNAFKLVFSAKACVNKVVRSVKMVKPWFFLSIPTILSTTVLNDIFVLEHCRA